MKFSNIGRNLAKSFAVACLVTNTNPFNNNQPAQFVAADQPVHCIREELYGVWNFHVSSDKSNINLFDTKELCTHSVPNKIQMVNKSHKFQFAGEDIYRINLIEGYKAEAVVCKGGNKGQCDKKVINGKWTAIYDQALNIELDNGMRFVANLRYNIKNSITEDPYKEAQEKGTDQWSQIETGDYDKFDSQCTGTMVGFIHNLPEITGQTFTLQNHQVQCFFAEQEKHYDFEKSKQITNGKVKWNKIVEHHSVKAENLIQKNASLSQQKKKSTTTKDKKASPIKINKVKAKKRVNMHLEHKPSDEMDLLISAVNAADLGWKADVCKYQKTHPNYGKHCDEAVLLQTSEKDDDDQGIQSLEQQELDTNKKEFGAKGDKDFDLVLEKARRWQKQYGNSHDIPDSEIPEKLDYRDIDGYDFTSYFRDQGKCGSCYTISMTQVMEARIKLKYGKQPPMLSPQMLMTCNYMNEGCDGGWPHFNVFMSENGHLVSEDCAPYIHRTKGDDCKNYQQCKPISKVKKSYFVGGGWGNTSEKRMMKEILRNGPINGDFQAPSMFSIYKEGIFSEKGLIDIHKQNQENIMLAQMRSSGTENTDEEQNEQENQETQDSIEKKMAENLSDKTLNDRGISWMDMNHSVVIIGWGKEDKTGTGYWIVRNSYGPNWGMNGDFLVKRGNNDFGMEVEQIAFEPILCSEESTDSCIPLQM